MKNKQIWVVIIFLCTLLLNNNISNAQTNGQSKRKSIYAELLGSAVMGSVNYDFRFQPQQDGLGMRLGIGMVPDVLVIPVELNGLIGKKRLAFEYGAGISTGIFLINKPGDQTYPSGIDGVGFVGFAKAGIRLQPLNNGIIFNLNWMPMVNADEIRWVWFGLGIGYSWKK